MKVRYLGLATLAAALLALVPAAKADYPEALESRVRSQLSRALASAEYGVSFRACLLTDEELLVEVTVSDADPAAAGQALESARAQVAGLLQQFPDVKLSELSSFRVARPAAVQVAKAGRPSQLYALK